MTAILLHMLLFQASAILSSAEASHIGQIPAMLLFHFPLTSLLPHGRVLHAIAVFAHCRLTGGFLLKIQIKFPVFWMGFDWLFRSFPEIMKGYQTIRAKQFLRSKKIQVQKISFKGNTWLEITSIFCLKKHPISV